LINVNFAAELLSTLGKLLVLNC